MTEPYEYPRTPRQYAEQVLDRSQQILQSAVEVVRPDSIEGLDSLRVFPAPGERCADDPGLELSETQETQLRKVAAELGFGREGNRTITELGLRGGDVIIEGGQAHKMLAEAMLVVDDTFADPYTIIITASPHRQIKEAEAKITARVLGIGEEEVGETEYDVARQVAESLPAFKPLKPERILEVGYDIDNDFALTDEPKGRQFTYIGHQRTTPVFLLRVDRENYEEDGHQKYRKQPDAAAIIGIVDAARKVDGGDGTNIPISFVTSGTYEASRNVAATRAALETNRVVGVATYGTALLAKTKRETALAPAPINQLPGELHKMAAEVAKLEEILRAA